jgi:hypothetical protein
LLNAVEFGTLREAAVFGVKWQRFQPRPAAQQSGVPDAAAFAATCVRFDAVS